jgi:LuxR family transcriptional regulator, maltose regulon positive regulatory protein
LNCKPILEYLERGNLFLVSIDDERVWYRYHHLFADLLRARLNQVYPGLIPKLHAHAAAWLEHSGLTIDAITHYLAAGEYDHAAHLVEENTTRLLAQGEVNALMSWIEVLPAELRLARPRLCIHQAYVLIMGGRLAEVAPLLTQVDAMLRVSAGQVAPQLPDDKAEINPIHGKGTESISPAESRSLAGSMATVRAMSATLLGQNSDAISYAKQARELLPPESLWDRTASGWALGFALHMQGNLSEARKAFEEQVRLW